MQKQKKAKHTKHFSPGSNAAYLSRASMDATKKRDLPRVSNEVTSKRGAALLREEVRLRKIACAAERARSLQCVS